MDQDRPRAYRRTTWPERWSRWLACVLAGLCASAIEAADAPPGEYQLKAVFLFSLVQFVDWPASAHATPNSPIVLGIVGKDPFGRALDEVVRGEKVRGRTLEVRRLREGDSMLGCHLVFIPGAFRDAVGDLLRELQGRPVLTVGETPAFAIRGGVFNFVLVNEQVRFEVNRQAAARQGLKVSSKLLNLSRLVDENREDRKP